MHVHLTLQYQEAFCVTQGTTFESWELVIHQGRFRLAPRWNGSSSRLAEFSWRSRTKSGTLINTHLELQSKTLGQGNWSNNSFLQSRRWRLRNRDSDVYVHVVTGEPEGLWSQMHPCRSCKFQKEARLQGRSCAVICHSLQTTDLYQRGKKPEIYIFHTSLPSGFSFNKWEVQNGKLDCERGKAQLSSSIWRCLQQWVQH